ncbi:MAG: hypothetical protein IKN53_05630, partial [Oscillibacter sp.]|nr:hypothetical protein [Oscillibacter sp.]
MRKKNPILNRLLAFALALLLLAETPGLTLMTRAYLAPQLTVTLYSGDTMPNGDAETDSAMLFKTYLSEQRNPNDEITLAMNAQLPFEVTDDAIQLGTEEMPFAGTIRFNVISEASFTCTKALFAYISTDAQFLVGGGSTPFTDPMTFTRVPTAVAANVNSALFADHVVKGTADSIAWNIICQSDGENALTYAGVLGEIGENAAVELTYVNNAKDAESRSNVYSQGNVGLVCG